mmetsp:Transcript_24496/g.77305  ORF Transcript_24496/g.77305 Transcript_24496/m.77305 type:complete len:248 (+) Transcript_24496:30-773(+)
MRGGSRSHPMSTQLACPCMRASIHSGPRARTGRHTCANPGLAATPSPHRPTPNVAASGSRLRVEEDGPALKQCLGPAVGNVLLDQGGLEGRSLLLHDALAASVEGRKAGHALLRADLGLLLEVILQAPEVCAARDAARVIKISGVLEGLEVHVRLQGLGVRAQGLVELRLALHEVRPDRLLGNRDFGVCHGEAREVALVKGLLDGHVPLHREAAGEEPVLELSLDEGDLLLAVLLVARGRAHGRRHG